MKSLLNKAGLYLHIPFCEKKCAYCDFYSVFSTNEMMDKYLSALTLEIKKWGGRFDRPIDTVYIGGGTPSLLGERIIPLLECAKESFNLEKDCEITAEINPNADQAFLKAAYRAGVNRLSMGVQSGNDKMLKALGRNHTADMAEATFKKARETGFKNISLDLMIALPESDLTTLKGDMDFLCGMEPEHISAYILKIEENTAFYRDKTLKIPDDEEAAAQYLFMCEYLEQKGYLQYEISNFSKVGAQSRHNLKYWNLDEYLGIGPSAHSFMENERFYYPRDLKEFINNPQTVSDGKGGDWEERLMLALRLSDGADITEYIEELPASLDREIENLQKAELLAFDGKILKLTPKGMLLSNSIITDITELIYENI